ADGVLVEILQDADVVHALVAGVAWRLTLSADAVLARRADVAARAAVVPVTDHIDALPVALLLTGLRTAARAEEAREPVPHWVPQAPQFKLSHCRLAQKPLQSVSPPRQAQTPSVQNLPPWQTLPQPPQFSSVSV